MIFKISAGEPHHAKGIAQVHVGSWRTTYKGIVADATLANMNIEVRIKQWANRLADKEPRTCTFVAMDPNEQVIGFANGVLFGLKSLRRTGSYMRSTFMRNRSARGSAEPFFGKRPAT
jgi:hypothetical protein